MVLVLRKPVYMEILRRDMISIINNINIRILFAMTKEKMMQFSALKKFYKNKLHLQLLDFLFLNYFQLF